MRWTSRSRIASGTLLFRALCQKQKSSQAHQAITAAADPIQLYATGRRGTSSGKQAQNRPDPINQSDHGAFPVKNTSTVRASATGGRCQRQTSASEAISRSGAKVQVALALTTSRSSKLPAVIREIAHPRSSVTSRG